MIPINVPFIQPSFPYLLYIFRLRLLYQNHSMTFAKRHVHLSMNRSVFFDLFPATRTGCDTWLWIKGHISWKASRVRAYAAAFSVLFGCLPVLLLPYMTVRGVLLVQEALTLLLVTFKTFASSCPLLPEQSSTVYKKNWGHRNILSYLTASKL